MQGPQIHVLLENPDIPLWLTNALQRINAQPRIGLLHRELEAPTRHTADARVIITSVWDSPEHRRLKSFWEEEQARRCATLVVMPEAPISPRISDPSAHVPVEVTGPLSPEVLAGRLAAMCSLVKAMNAAGQGATAAMERSSDAVSESDLDDQLRLASRIQRELTPSAMPEMPGIRLTAESHPAGLVSGDLYDAFRLDEQRVALFLADVTGHGLPAAWMTIYLRRWLGQVTTASEGLATSWMTPDLMLARLNELMQSSDLGETRYLAAAWAVYDPSSGELTWARGGLPYPILIRRDQGARRLRTTGALIGAVPDPTFERAAVSLCRGDRVVFFTDGAEEAMTGLACGAADSEESESSLLEWLGSRSTREISADLARSMATDRAAGRRSDDATLLALEVT